MGMLRHPFVIPACRPEVRPSCSARLTTECWSRLQQRIEPKPARMLPISAVDVVVRDHLCILIVDEDFRAWSRCGSHAEARSSDRHRTRQAPGAGRPRVPHRKQRCAATKALCRRVAVFAVSRISERVTWEFCLARCCHSDQVTGSVCLVCSSRSYLVLMPVLPHQRT